MTQKRPQEHFPAGAFAARTPQSASLTAPLLGEPSRFYDSLLASPNRGGGKNEVFDGGVSLYTRAFLICIFLRRGRNEIVDDDPAHDRGADTPAAEHGARAERDAVGERGEARYEREHARKDRPARLGAVEKIRAQPEHREKAHRNGKDLHAVRPEDRVRGVFLIEHHEPQTEKQHRQHAERRAEAAPAGDLRHHGEHGRGQDAQQRRGRRPFR